jgi:hypothetical protein
MALRYEHATQDSNRFIAHALESFVGDLAGAVHRTVGDR